MRKYKNAYPSDSYIKTSAWYKKGYDVCPMHRTIDSLFDGRLTRYVASVIRQNPDCEGSPLTLGLFWLSYKDYKNAAANVVYGIGPKTIAQADELFAFLDRYVSEVWELDAEHAIDAMWNTPSFVLPEFSPYQRSISERF